MRLPAVTILIIIACLFATYLPGLSSALIFDRDAIIKGEFWRILTGHFVHFSPSHIAYDIFSFGIAGCLIEKSRYPCFSWLILWLALSISMSLLLLEPDMRYYGGLSGISFGALYYCALMGMKESSPWRTICFLMLAILPIKIAFEIFSGSSILPYGERQSFVPMQTSHIVGCLTALVFYLAISIISNLSRKSPDRQEALSRPH